MAARLDETASLTPRRFITMFNPAAQHFTLSEPIVLTNSFTFEFDYYAGYFGIDVVLFGDYTDESNYWSFGIDTEGSFVYKQMVAGVEESLKTYPIANDYKLRRVVFSRDIDFIRIETNRTLSEKVFTHLDLSLSSIGGLNGDMYPNGSLSNLSLRDTSTVVLDCPFDDDITNSGEDLTLGVNIVNNAGNIVVTGINFTATSTVLFTEVNNEEGEYLFRNPSIELMEGLDPDNFNLVGLDWGDSRYASDRTDGVMVVESIFENTLTTTSWLYLGSGLRKLDQPYELDNVVYRRRLGNSQTIRLINRSSNADGGLFNWTLTPILAVEDPRPYYKIVFLGDSITARLFQYEGDRIYNIIRERGILNFDTINAGHGGLTSRGLNGVLDTYLDQVRGEKRVLFVMMMGTNVETTPTGDSYRATEGLYRYLREMTKRIKAEGHEAAIMQKTASSSNESSGNLHSANTGANDLACRDFTPFWYDFAKEYPLLKTYDWTMGTHALGWFADNVHLNAMGARGLSEKIAPVLEERLPLLFSCNEESSTLTITVDGKADGPEVVRLWTKNGFLIRNLFDGEVDFSAGSFTVQLPVKAGTEINGQYDGDNPPVTGSGLYGVTE